ncbi:hypothetical protein [Erwinia sorbitola]|uniref:hypothetical protein n=1 Tax=Erwinia sorbitola TaxID=2681984 RepID=UPI0012B96233|nr:hypothetical protein [Erwinia sorbitola]
MKIKEINIITWVGLLINIILFGFFWFLSFYYEIMINELYLSEHQLPRIFSVIYIPFGIAVAVQFISLMILFKFPKSGRALAVISSMVMLPLSLVFLIGYMFSYEKHCSENLAVYNKQPADIGLIFKSSSALMQGVLFIALGLFVIFLGLGAGGLVAGVGVLSLCHSFHLKNRTMIGMMQGNLILTPGIYSDTYIIPLADVTLIKEDDRLFKLHIRSAGVDRKCTFRKGMIESEKYQEPLKEILSKIARQE